MKKLRDNSKWKIVIIVIICLTFIVGIGVGVKVGTYITQKKVQKTGEAKRKDMASNDSSQVTGDGVGFKEDKELETDHTEKNPSNNQKDSGSQEVSQKEENNEESGKVQETENTYDSSAPADDSSTHRYEYIISDSTWQEAFQDCINRGGYLVRINSSKEYEMIRKEISKQKMTDRYFKIGGRRDSQSQDYYWVNQDGKLFGEKLNAENSWCFDEWMGGEPSFRDGDLEEKYMALFFYDGEKRFVWNDIPDDMLAAEPAYSGKLGYICEYED